MTRIAPICAFWVTSTRKSLENLTFSKWLRWIWIALIVWVQEARYWFMSSCDWGDRSLAIHIADHIKPTHVLIISDPRVRFAPLYKPSLLGDIYDWFYKLNLRTTWKVALSFKPHATIFLGDMLASGRKVKNAEDFAAYYAHFRKIFSFRGHLPMFFVPGNEDIGLNLKLSDAHRARENYLDNFGPPNTEVSLGNHTLVLLDAPGLVEEDYQRADDHGKTYDDWRPIDGGTVQFVKALQNFSVDGEFEPRILFSHIPLARPETAYCGPLRVKGSIHRGAGPGYQNMLGKQTTEFLLTTVKPAIVFSGDDRDYCEIRHSVSIDGTETFIPEISITSFSPVDDIPAVGFHLLSLVPPSSDPDVPPRPTIAHSACFVPVPMRAYTSIYFPAVLLTFLALLAHKFWSMRRQTHRRRLGNDGSDLELAADADKGASFRAHRPQISLGRSRDVSPWLNKAPSPWAWTFTFGGRRRRLVLYRPRLPFVGNVLASVHQRLDKLLPRGNALDIVTDFLAIIWPAVALWTALTWWTLR